MQGDELQCVCASCRSKQCLAVSGLWPEISSLHRADHPPRSLQDGHAMTVCAHKAAAHFACPQVMESWASILRGVRPNAFKITLEDVRVFALSETTGLVTCVEVVEADDSKGR